MVAANQVDATGRRNEHLNEAITQRSPSRVSALICGGLGNQLFIYAAARSLTRRIDAELRLDVTTGFARDRKYRRSFALNAFDFRMRYAEREDCFPGIIGRLREVALKRLARAGLTECWFVDESRSTMPAACRRIFLRGYWQSERHFIEDEARLRAELVPLQPLSASAASQREAMAASEHSVAIAMRSFQEVPPRERGFVASPEYYRRAFEHLNRRLPHARYFVFTDDVQWAKAMLKFSPRQKMITNEAGQHAAWEDLLLMGCCKHAIIGNGTLHWWGAWLGRNPTQIVCVPGDYAAHRPDYYPECWRRF